MDAGFWAITKLDDIQLISQDHETFSSSAYRGNAGFRSFNRDGAMPPTFLLMDPPEHTRYRQIMSAAFTPKAVARLDEKITERAERIVDGIADGGEFDFVRDVSAKLPMLTVADLVGVPEALVHTFAEAGDNFICASDPEFVPDGLDPMAYMTEQLGILTQIGVELIEFRRKNPADDIATALANFQPDGHPLTVSDIGSMMVLLSVAGNDTTKQTTSASVVSLWKNLDQRAWLMDDFDARIGQSIEEFVRHASPVIAFSRLVTKDTELRGQHLDEGDKVVLFYSSGNRDEEIWPDAHAFDLQRERKAHAGFGGGGVHFCLGNGVAKAQLRALFKQILTRVPHMEVGAPEQLNSDFINGTKRLSVTVA